MIRQEDALYENYGDGSGLYTGNGVQPLFFHEHKSITMEWLSVKKYLPPYNTLVLIKDDNQKSVGRIKEIKMVMNAASHEKKVDYTWTSIEPYVHSPTHWMHLPE